MAQPTPELTEAINHLHAAIEAEADPQSVMTLSQCLAKMTQVQKDIMQGGGAQNGGGVAQGTSAGYGGGSPPSGPQTAADPQLQALLSGMGGQ